MKLSISERGDNFRAELVVETANEFRRHNSSIRESSSQIGATSIEHLEEALDRAHTRLLSLVREARLQCESNLAKLECDSYARELMPNGKISATPERKS